MNIALVDIDSHNFPNLVLMKLSAWHKAKGDNVSLVTPDEIGYFRQDAGRLRHHVPGRWVLGTWGYGGMKTCPTRVKEELRLIRRLLLEVEKAL